jgi:hypothetical protein
VEAAKQEFDMALTFHETWKPAAYDKDLHKRMGDSFATHTFLVVRLALRREMLLALMRLWDRDGRNVGMELSIADLLRDQSVVHALAADRVARMGMASWEDEMRSELSQRTSEAIALVEKYSETGSHYATLRKLRRLRNQRLAHRPAKEVAATGLDPTDEEIESFYQIIPSSSVCFSALSQALLTTQMTPLRFIAFTPNSFGLGCEGSERKAIRTTERQAARTSIVPRARRPALRR